MDDDRCGVRGAAATPLRIRPDVVHAHAGSRCPCTQSSRSADEHDQRVAGDLDRPHGVAHRLRGRAEQHRGDANDRDRDERLQQRRGERQHDAAPPGFLVGDEIGRDHRLAVAGTGGMENAVDERDAHQPPHRAAVGLGGADEAGQCAVELACLAKSQPTKPGACGGLRASRERLDLRARRPSTRSQRAASSSEQEAITVRAQARPWPTSRVTGISPISCWRNSRPCRYWLPTPSGLIEARIARRNCRHAASRHRAPQHCAPARSTSRTGSFSAKAKSMKKSGS